MDIKRVIDDITELAATGFSANDVPQWSGSAWLSPGRGTSPWTRTVIVDVGGLGDYTTIKAACDYVATQSPATLTPWIIDVKAGVYDEADFVVPVSTTIRGAGPSTSGNFSSTVIRFATLGGTSGAHITLSTASHLVDLIIQSKSAVQTGNKSVISTTGTSAMLINVDIAGLTTQTGVFTNYLVDVGSTTGFFVWGGRWNQNASGANMTILNAGGTTSVRNAWITMSSAGAGSTGIKVAVGKTVTLIHCRLNNATAVFTTDIDNSAGGTVVVNNTPYITFSGTITHLDLATTTVPGMVKKSAAVADLNQTISNPPTQAEVQAISDKIDELLGVLRTAGILSST